MGPYFMFRMSFRRVCAVRVLFIAILYASAFAGTSYGAASDPVELRVMSFNVRFSKVDHSEAASENNWADLKFPPRAGDSCDSREFA